MTKQELGEHTVSLSPHRRARVTSIKDVFDDDQFAVIVEKRVGWWLWRRWTYGYCVSTHPTFDEAINSACELAQNWLQTYEVH